MLLGGQIGTKCLHLPFGQALELDTFQCRDNVRLDCVPCAGIGVIFPRQAFHLGPLAQVTRHGFPRGRHIGSLLDLLLKRSRFSDDLLYIP